MILGTGSVASQESQLSVLLDYETVQSANCPTRQQFERLIAEQLGYSPSGASDATYRVRVKIEPAASGFSGSAQWFDSDGTSQGERRLSPGGRADCATVGRDLAFAVVVQIQLLGSMLPPAPPPKTVEERNEPTPDNTQRADKSWVAGLGGFGASGLTPEIAPGARAFGAFRLDSASLELSAEYWFAPDVSAGGGSGFSSRLIAGTLAPCARWGRFSACGVGTVGHLQVEGFGVDNELSPGDVVVAAGARVAVAFWRASRWEASVHFGTLVPLRKHTVELNEEPVWSTEAVSFALGLDLAALFR